jgi:hypothetical protein
MVGVTGVEQTPTITMLGNGIGVFGIAQWMNLLFEVARYMSYRPCEYNSSADG